jgi:RNA-directed DNA polymerase
VAHLCKAGEQAERSAAEPVEPRAGTEGNANQQHTGRAQSRETVTQVLARIRQTARVRKKERFTALFHHINVELLGDAFFAIRREAPRRRRGDMAGLRGRSGDKSP